MVIFTCTLKTSLIFYETERWRKKTGTLLISSIASIIIECNVRNKLFGFFFLVDVSSEWFNWKYFGKYDKNGWFWFVCVIFAFLAVFFFEWMSLKRRYKYKLALCWFDGDCGVSARLVRHKRWAVGRQVWCKFPINCRQIFKNPLKKPHKLITGSLPVRRDFEYDSQS